MGGDPTAREKRLGLSPLDSAEAIQIASEEDRIYLDTKGAVEILDSKLRRRIRIDKTGSASTVVWNPWSAKAQQMPDFGNDEYKQMVCVESGNVAKNKVTLLPGRTSVLKVTIGSELELVPQPANRFFVGN